ncbi:putative nuclease HARBI1 [Pecten maximus]|uniref:putative nuclease HARBI1 n=1 Tax=Pecten maximus TaxID=6579 RepID=UPI0014582667|nr:putative nuclease HARBI1 [Pecten maximus]
MLLMDFFTRSGFPGVVGAVDGTHIPIPGPSSHRDSYINRKSFPSIQLQADCDSNLVFRDVYAGWPGSVHDARVWRNCPLSQILPSLPPNQQLLGHSAYPLSVNLLVPFRDNGHLSCIEKKYNKSHSSTRVDIERAFGLLKCKFRRLQFLDMHLFNEIPNVIVACCVLHNFILLNESFDGEEFDMPDDTSCPLADDKYSGQVAFDKRLEIANLLV